MCGWVSEGRRRACFLEEAAAAVLLRDVFLRQDLQCDDALELVVVSFVDCAHATGADGLDDPIMGDGLDRNGLHGWKTRQRYQVGFSGTRTKAVQFSYVLATIG